MLRLFCPEVNSQAKGHGELSIHFAADQETIGTIFRIIVSANQLSLYGAVAEICEVPSRKNGATCCDGTINRAQCDQDRSFFGE